MTTVTGANYNKKEEKEIKDEKFYSYVNLVHNQSFFPYAEKSISNNLAVTSLNISCFLSSHLW